MNDRWYSGHIGEMILATVFLVSLGAFTLVYLKTGKESQMLGGAVLAALSALATYMQKRGTQIPTTNVETANINKVETVKE